MNLWIRSVFVSRGESDKFRRRSSRADVVELACQEHFLPFSREPACHPAPEDAFLNLAPFARKTKSCITPLPQLVHVKLITGEAKPGAQQKPCQCEPGLFVLHGELPAGGLFVQGRPKSAQKSSIPLMPGQEEDAFEVFQDRIGSQPVGLCRAGECDRDVIPRGSPGLGSSVRLGRRRSWRTRHSRPAVLVRTQVEFERPRLRHPGICADTRNLQQSQFIHFCCQTDGRGTVGPGVRLIRRSDDRL